MVLIQCEFVALYFAVECWDRVEILSKELLNDMKIFAFCILLIWSKLKESLLTHFSEIILEQRGILGIAKMAHTYGPILVQMAVIAKAEVVILDAHAWISCWFSKTYMSIINITSKNLSEW